MQGLLCKFNFVKKNVPRLGLKVLTRRFYELMPNWNGPPDELKPQRFPTLVLLLRENWRQYKVRP